MGTVGHKEAGQQLRPALGEDPRNQMLKCLWLKAVLVISLRGILALSPVFVCMCVCVCVCVRERERERERKREALAGLLFVSPTPPSLEHALLLPLLRTPLLGPLLSTPFSVILNSQGSSPAIALPCGTCPAQLTFLCPPPGLLPGCLPEGERAIFWRGPEHPRATPNLLPSKDLCPASPGLHLGHYGA